MPLDRGFDLFDTNVFLSQILGFPGLGRKLPILFDNINTQKDVLSRMWVLVCIHVLQCERKRQGSVPALQSTFQLLGADCTAPPQDWPGATWQPKKGALPGPAQAELWP